MHGKGIFYYSKNIVRNWKINKIHGKGILNSPNGQKYSGESNENKMHEKGVLYSCVMGKNMWQNDKKNGKGT